MAAREMSLQVEGVWVSVRGVLVQEVKEKGSGIGGTGLEGCLWS